MIATIDGITVMGSPEEIQRFREITAKKKKGNGFFKVPESDVPEHVKRYGSTTFVSDKDSKINAWY